MPRKQAFSGKQKKQQLQSKKVKKNIQRHAEGASSSNQNNSEDSFSDEEVKFVRPSSEKSTSNAAQPLSSSDSPFKFFEVKPNSGRGVQQGRYVLKFRPESNEVCEKNKREARKAIIPVSEEYLECSVEDFFCPGLDFPIRPPWDYNLSKEALENQESKYFASYLKEIDENFETSELSYFELNLETWRQFWRVLEMSDILLCVIDIRFPPLLFPPKLYEYCSTKLGKNVIIVLNKIDLVKPTLVLAWKDYFREKFPDIDVLCFTSYEGRDFKEDQEEGTSNVKMKGRRKFRKLRMAAQGALELHKTIEKIVAGQVDLSSWKSKIIEEMNSGEGEDDEVTIQTVDASVSNADYYEFKKYQNGILTIGTIGQPNTGKSSLINGLMGKKVVSVSKTPGHTKHFQTIYLTQNVRLCDCPGLIFPSRVPKSLQVLCGSYPIAQLREPYSTVKYLGERLNLPRLLKIEHPEGEKVWSAFDIADGWAKKRGYYTAKASRLDSYRGANFILRLALEGRIVLALHPPGYKINEGKYKDDPRLQEIETLYAFKKTSHDVEELVDESSSGEDNVDEEDSDDNLNTSSKGSFQIKNTNKFSLLNDEEDDDDDE